MMWGTCQPVIGELENLVDQRGEVVAGQPVENAAALTEALDQSGQSQPAQVLGDRGARGRHLRRERADVLLGDQQAQ